MVSVTLENVSGEKDINSESSRILCLRVDIQTTQLSGRSLCFRLRIRSVHVTLFGNRIMVDAI